MSYETRIVREVRTALTPLSNPVRAAGAQAYMKNIAPFLGVATPDRRAAIKPIFTLHIPETSEELGQAARALMKLREREFSYAAYDLIQFHITVADKNFLADHVEDLLTTKSWWDTVDGLGSAAVSPLTVKYPNKRLIERWIRSSDKWLVRAAIQHQRGRRSNTDVDYVLELCSRHADSREFFITKAVGWALRDIAAFNKPAVRAYLKEFPGLDRVSVREAERGLNR